MKQIMALLLASSLMVPLLSTEAFCAKPHAAAPHKKAARHKRHAGHAKATQTSASGQKAAASRPTTTQQ